MASEPGRLQEFRLPDVGEGLEEAEIVTWKVRVGEQVTVNQPIVEIETAKSLVELPSPYTGIVAELLVAEGETAAVGTPIIHITADGSADAATATDAAEVDSGTLAREARTEVLVGSGPREHDAPRRPRGARSFGRHSTPITTTPITPAVPVTPSTSPAPPAPAARAVARNDDRLPQPPPDRPLASPPVRKYARDAGVDIATLTGTGTRGVITREDVRLALEAYGAAGPTMEGTAGGTSSHARSAEGPTETRAAIRGVRRSTAQAMVRSAFTAPHVTEFVTVDVTESVLLLKRLAADREFAGLRLSALVLVARAMCIAARRTPEINSFWDEQAQEIVTKHYVNLGIAAATDRGLLVPNIKNADRLGLRDLAAAITEVTLEAREGRSTPERMAGGTMTITNIGVFGIDTGTPILPPGESAILCLGAIGERPWVVDGALAVRQVTTLGLSFDHRLIDGAQGSRFLGDVARLLRDPACALAW